MIWALTTIGHGDLALLPHWIRHYDAMGVDRICICIVGVDGRNVAHVFEWAKQWTSRDILCAAEVLEADHFGFDQHVIQINSARHYGLQPNDWVMVADLDEFYEFPPNTWTLVNDGTGRGSDFKHNSGIDMPGQYAFFADMLAPDGVLAEVKPDVPLIEQFPIATHLTRDFLEGGDRKVMLHRAWMNVSEGHHDLRPNGREVPSIAPFGICRHYKFKAGLVERLRKHISNPACHDRPRRECQKLLVHIEANGGRINLAEISGAATPKQC